MNRTVIGLLLITLLGIACLVAIPDRAVAQYQCAVAIELKGKAVLKGEIRDTERPSTDQLWELLKSLSFSPTKDGKDLPSAKSAEQATLKGEIRVKVNGAGEVALRELGLVRNQFNPDAWVIAPADVALIIKMRKASGK